MKSLPHRVSLSSPFARRHRRTVTGLLAIIVLTLAVGVQAATYNWSGGTIGGTYNWDNAGSQNNWGTGAGGAFPNVAGDVANIVGAFSTSTTLTFNLNQDITVGELSFYRSPTAENQPTLIIATGSPGGTLILDNGASPATISVGPDTHTSSRSGTPSIAANIRLDSDVDVRVPARAHGSSNIVYYHKMTISGNISQGGGGDRSLNKIGGSRLLLSGANTYAGGTGVTTGALVFLNADALPTTGSLSTAAGAYMGARFEVSQSNFIDRFDKNATFGTIGIETATANAIDLTGFDAGVRLGGTATFSGAFTPQGDTYRFAGGAGDSTANNSRAEYQTADVFTVGSLLADGPGSTTRHLNIGDGTTLFGGTVWLTNTDNTLSGITTVDTTPTRRSTLRISGDGSLGTAPAAPTPGKIVLASGILQANSTLTVDANRGIALGPADGSGSGALSSAAGTLNYGGVIADHGSGSGSLVVPSGHVALTGQNSYTGSTTINAAKLFAIDGVGLPSGNLVFSGAGDHSTATLESNGTFTRSLGTGASQVSWSTRGGFAAVGGPLIVNLGGVGATINYSSFNGGLHFGTSTDNDVVIFENALNLNTATAVFGLYNASGSTVITGKLSGSGTITSHKEARGLLVFANDENDFTGQVTTDRGNRTNIMIGFTSIRNVGEGPSALGAPTSVANGTIAVGLQGTNGIRYLGTDPDGHSSDRIFEIYGTNGTGRVDASGVGPLTLTSSPTFPIGGSPLRLGGTGEGRWPANLAGITSLTKDGSGLWTLPVANTYSVATTINAGALRAADGTGLPTNSRLILENGVFETSGTFTRALGIGGGQVGWTSASSNFGGFSAHGAPLSVNLGGNATPDTISWTATGFANASGLRFGSAWSDSVVTFENPLNLLNAARTVHVDDNPASTADRAVLAGVISSSTTAGGLVKTGAGTLVLTAENTYTGATTVEAGTLLVENSSDSGTGPGAVVINGGLVAGSGFIGSGGSLATVTVNPTGTLGGNLTVTGTVANSGGTISPGASPGKITVDGDVTQTSTGTMLFEFAGPVQGTGYDWLDVSGTATLGDGILQVSLIDGFLPKHDTYTATIITAGTLTNLTTFGSLTLLPSDVLNAVTVTYDYNGGSVILSEFDLFPLADIVVSSAGGGNYLFDGQGSYDPDDEDPATYATLDAFEWTLNGVVLAATGSQVTQPLGGGVHVLTLVVTDDEGTTGSMTLTFMVPEPGAFALLALAMTLAGLRRRRGDGIGTTPTTAAGAKGCRPRPASAFMS